MGSLVNDIWHVQLVQTLSHEQKPGTPTASAIQFDLEEILFQF